MTCSCNVPWKTHAKCNWGIINAINYTCAALTSMNAFATSTFYITVQKENRGLLRVIGVDVFWIISLIFFNNNNNKKSWAAC